MDFIVDVMSYFILCWEDTKVYNTGAVSCVIPLCWLFCSCVFPPGNVVGEQRDAMLVMFQWKNLLPLHRVWLCWKAGRDPTNWMLPCPKRPTSECWFCSVLLQVRWYPVGRHQRRLLPGWTTTPRLCPGSWYPDGTPRRGGSISRTLDLRGYSITRHGLAGWGSGSFFWVEWI